MSCMADIDCRDFVSIINKQFQRKESLKAREKALMKQLDNWRLLLQEKTAAQFPQCPRDRPNSSSRPSSRGKHSPSRSRPKSASPDCSCRSKSMRGRAYEEVRPATAGPHRRRHDYDEDLTTHWTNSLFTAPCRPQTACLCQDGRDSVLSRLIYLASDETRIVADIEDTEKRILATCDAIRALKQVYLVDQQALASQVEDLLGKTQANSTVPCTPSAPSPSNVPAPDPQRTPPTPLPQPQVPPTVSFPLTTPKTEPNKPCLSALTDSVAARKSSIIEATNEMGSIRKNLDGVEDVVKNHASKTDIFYVQDSLSKIEVSIMSAHFSLATLPLRGEEDAESIVSYRTPTEIIAFWNEMESTKRRLSVLVNHAKECAICKDKFNSTFLRIDEELMGLSEELRRHHTEDMSTNPMHQKLFSTPGVSEQIAGLVEGQAEIEQDGAGVGKEGEPLVQSVKEVIESTLPDDLQPSASKASRAFSSTSQSGLARTSSQKSGRQPSIPSALSPSAASVLKTTSQSATHPLSSASIPKTTSQEESVKEVIESTLPDDLQPSASKASRAFSLTSQSGLARTSSQKSGRQPSVPSALSPSAASVPDTTSQSATHPPSSASIPKTTSQKSARSPSKVSVHLVPNTASQLGPQLDEEEPTIEKAVEADENLANDVTEDINTETADGVSEEIPEAAPEEVAEALPEEVAEGVLEETAGAVPEEVAEALPEEVAEGVLEETAGAVPEEVAEGVLEETAGAVPEEVAEAVPEEVAEVALEETAGAVPEEVAEAVPEEVAEVVLEDAAEAILEEEVGETAEGLPEEVPEDDVDVPKFESAVDILSIEQESNVNAETPAEAPILVLSQEQFFESKEMQEEVKPQLTPLIPPTMPPLQPLTTVKSEVLLPTSSSHSGCSVLCWAEPSTRQMMPAELVTKAETVAPEPVISAQPKSPTSGAAMTLEDWRAITSATNAQISQVAEMVQALAEETKMLACCCKVQKPCESEHATPPGETIKREPSKIIDKSSSKGSTRSQFTELQEKIASHPSSQPETKRPSQESIRKSPSTQPVTTTASQESVGKSLSTQPVTTTVLQESLEISPSSQSETKRPSQESVGTKMPLQESIEKSPSIQPVGTAQESLGISPSSQPETKRPSQESVGKSLSTQLVTTTASQESLGLSPSSQPDTKIPLQESVGKSPSIQSVGTAQESLGISPPTQPETERPLQESIGKSSSTQPVITTHSKESLGISPSMTSMTKQASRISILNSPSTTPEALRLPSTASNIRKLSSGKTSKSKLASRASLFNVDIIIEENPYQNTTDIDTNQDNIPALSSVIISSEDYEASEMDSRPALVPTRSSGPEVFIPEVVQSIIRRSTDMADDNEKPPGPAKEPCRCKLRKSKKASNVLDPSQSVEKCKEARHPNKCRCKKRILPLNTIPEKKTILDESDKIECKSPPGDYKPPSSESSRTTAERGPSVAPSKHSVETYQENIKTCVSKESVQQFIQKVPPIEESRQSVQRTQSRASKEQSNKKTPSQQSVQKSSFGVSIQESKQNVLSQQSVQESLTGTLLQQSIQNIESITESRPSVQKSQSIASKQSIQKVPFAMESHQSVQKSQSLASREQSIPKGLSQQSVQKSPSSTREQQSVQKMPSMTEHQKVQSQQSVQKSPSKASIQQSVPKMPSSIVQDVIENSISRLSQPKTSREAISNKSIEHILENLDHYISDPIQIPPEEVHGADVSQDFEPLSSADIMKSEDFVKKKQKKPCNCKKCGIAIIKEQALHDMPRQISRQSGVDSRQNLVEKDNTQSQSSRQSGVDRRQSSAENDDMPRQASRQSAADRNHSLAQYNNEIRQASMQKEVNQRQSIVHYDDMPSQASRQSAADRRQSLAQHNDELRQASMQSGLNQRQSIVHYDDMPSQASRQSAVDDMQSLVQSKEMTREASRQSGVDRRQSLGQSEEMPRQASRQSGVDRRQSLGQSEEMPQQASRQSGVDRRQSLGQSEEMPRQASRQSGVDRRQSLGQSEEMPRQASRQSGVDRRHSLGQSEEMPRQASRQSGVDRRQSLGQSEEMPRQASRQSGVDQRQSLGQSEEMPRQASRQSGVDRRKSLGQSDELPRQTSRQSRHETNLTVKPTRSKKIDPKICPAMCPIKPAISENAAEQ